MKMIVYSIHYKFKKSRKVLILLLAVAWLAFQPVRFLLIT